MKTETLDEFLARGGEINKKRKKVYKNPNQVALSRLHHGKNRAEHLERVKRYEEKNRDKILNYRRRYRADPKNRDVLNNAQIRFRYPEQLWKTAKMLTTARRRLNGKEKNPNQSSDSGNTFDVSRRNRKWKGGPANG